MKYEDISKGCEIPYDHNKCIFEHWDISADHVLCERDYSDKMPCEQERVCVMYGSKIWEFMYTEDNTWMAVDEYERIGL